MTRPAAATSASTPRNDRMSVDWWNIDRLKPPEGSPRRFSKADIAKAENVIRQFGVRLPLLVSADGQVVSHFIIISAAKRLGHTQIPVIVVDDLTGPMRDALGIALSRLYELGKFDQPLLGSALLELEITIPDLSFDSLGFEQGEVDRAIGAVQRTSETQEANINVDGPPVTKVGDIWLLGKHRIGCGDAEDAFWIDLLMAKPASMVFTDMPYGCKVSGFITTRAHRDFVQASGGENAQELQALFGIWCARLGAAAAPGAIVFLCIDWRSMPLLLAAGQKVFGDLLNLIVWDKGRAGMGSLYRSQHELILVFRAPGAPHRNNVALGKHGRDRTNVWKYPSAMSFGRSETEGDLLADHPTPKPKEMIADAILDCTKRADIISDPFLGSGSTLIAAEKTGRICHGSDLDPLYVDLAIRRWQAWTGLQARHASDGDLFDDRARAASAPIASQETDDE